MKRAIALLLSMSIIISIISCANMSFAAAKAVPPKTVSAWGTGKTTASVTWSKVSDAGKYYVYISGKKSGGYKKIATVKATKYNCAKLKENTRYYFIIKAVVGKKTSANSPVASAKTHKSYSVKKLNKAYYDVAKKYREVYGVATSKVYSKEDNYCTYYAAGVNLINYYDLNNDGVPEMIIGYTKNMKSEKAGSVYYAYGDFCFEVYCYQNAKAEKLYKHEMNYLGSDYAPDRMFSFNKVKGITYITEIYGSNGCPEVRYKTLKDGKIKQICKYWMNYKTEKFYKDKTEISYQIYAKFINVKHVFVTALTKSDIEKTVKTANNNFEKIKTRAGV